MNRLEKTFYENQPREQAGFRSRYSTTDHIYAVNQLKEKCIHDTLHRIRRLRETLRLSAISSSTDFASRTEDRSCEHRTAERYLHQKVNDSTTYTKKATRSTQGGGERQGDTISPKLFTAALESKWRDELDDYLKGTIWQRIAQNKQMWKQQAERPSSDHGTLWLHNDDDYDDDDDI